MRLLIAEDDPLIADGLIRAMRTDGYAVDHTTSGLEADEALKQYTYDLVILDLGLPRLDGLEVLRRLRTRGTAVPVLVLTARDALQDRVKGLDAGADDYLVKPFDLPELEARVRALLRRQRPSLSGRLHIGELMIDISGRSVYHGSQRIDLSAREFGVLELLARRAGRVVSKEQLLESLTGWDDDVGTNAIEVYVHRLRKKLEPGGINIRTIRGLGYLLDNATRND
ncbi:MAG: response regulator transcription factor [Betaproteobacteria bacterium]|nr:response regulator transcription factor [Betaproteobacteria bacterium]MBL8534405.1 response regulator transcription factor [Betaproteobacteria bacterium]